MAKKTKTIKELRDIPEAESDPADLPNMKGPGVERLRLPMLEKQAEIVTELSIERKHAAQKERDARVKLLDMLNEKGLSSYQLDDGRRIYKEEIVKAKIKSSEDQYHDPDEE